MFTEYAVFGERHAHLLGDRHEQVVEHFEQHRVGAACRSRARAAAASTRRAPGGRARVSVARQPGSTTVVALRSRMIAGRRSRRRGAARRGRRPARRATAPVEVHARRRRSARSAPARRRERRPAPPPRPRVAPIASTAIASMTSAVPGIRKPYCCRYCARKRSAAIGARSVATAHLQRRVGAVVLDVHACARSRCRIGAMPCASSVGARLASQRVERALAAPRASQRRAAASTARCRSARTSASPMPYADSTPASGWMNTRVMPSASATRHACWPAGAAEAAQRVLGDVVAALHRDLLDRVRHVLDGDRGEARGDCSGVRARRSSRELVGERRELLARRRPRRAARRRSGRTPPGRTPAGACRASRCNRSPSSGPPRRYDAGPDSAPADSGPTRKRAPSNRQIDPPPAATVWMLHHRRAQAHAGDLGVERALVLAGVVRDVGRRAAHVEADDLARSPRAATPATRADDAARRPGQDRVLALEQTARRSARRSTA